MKFLPITIFSGDFSLSIYSFNFIDADRSWCKQHCSRTFLL